MCPADPPAAKATQRCAGSPTLSCPSRVAADIGLLGLHSLEADSVDARGVEPANGALDGGDHLGRGVVEAHEEADDADALGRADARQLVGPGVRRLERLPVMLLTPRRELARDPDLAGEDAGDAALNGKLPAISKADGGRGDPAAGPVPAQ